MPARFRLTRAPDSQVRVAPKVGAGSRGGARARTQALKCPVQDCDFTRASTATDLVNHLCKAHAADVADACADSQKPSGEDHDLFRLPDTTHDDTAALFEMAAAMLEVPGTRQKVKECLRENESVGISTRNRRTARLITLAAGSCLVPFKPAPA